MEQKCTYWNCFVQTHMTHSLVYLWGEKDRVVLTLNIHMERENIHWEGPQVFFFFSTINVKERRGEKFGVEN